MCISKALWVDIRIFKGYVTSVNIAIFTITITKMKSLLLYMKVIIEQYQNLMYHVILSALIHTYYYKTINCQELIKNKLLFQNLNT